MIEKNNNNKCSWDDAWYYILSKYPDKRQRSLFIELVRGCRQKNCAYQCRAQKIPIITRGRMTIEAGRSLLETAPEEAKDTPVILYGTGDPNLLDWDNLRGDFEQSWIDQCQITMPANTTKYRLERIKKHFASDIRISVSTEEELDFAISVRSIIHGISVPGSKKVKLNKIISRAVDIFDVVCVRSTSCNRDDYLPPGEFAQRFGFEPRLRTTCKFGLVVHGAEFCPEAMSVYVRGCMDEKGEYTIIVPYNNGVYSKPCDGEALISACNKPFSCNVFKEERRWEWIS